MNFSRVDQFRKHPILESRIKPPSNRSNLVNIYEKTKLLRTVLERHLDFSEFESPTSFPTFNETRHSSLGILQPHEMDLGSGNTTDFSEGILTESQMNIGSFEDLGSKNCSDYLLKRLHKQIVLHNILLDASEKFPKSPSIENLVKKCMQGTQALEELKERVAAFKLKKQSQTPGRMQTLLRNFPNILRNAVDCAEELQGLSESISYGSESGEGGMSQSSSIAADVIKDISIRLREIENAWKNVPLPEEERSSFGLLHQSQTKGWDAFLNDSSSLANTFDRVNRSIKEVLQTPNTASLNRLKSELRECETFLTNLTQDQSLLFDETMPAFEDPSEEESLLHEILDELDKSALSEIEAFLDVWKSPERERFLQISEDAINDLSSLRDETSHMLEQIVTKKSSSPSASDRRKNLIQRLDAIRASVQPNVSRTPIVLKDYLDESDMVTERSPYLPSDGVETTGKKTVQFPSLPGDQPVQNLPSTANPQEVQARLAILLAEMDRFQQDLKSRAHAPPQPPSANESTNDLFQQQLDQLMAMIADLIAFLRSN
ncbi:uncharacterized protein LOC131207116 [Anopheles bellator]|uniref:uncharacterized protein LOC131207116 n=1 Tax=Anopheles bellator TaxID=139047 RepID=UPI00264A129F|nr:uncharacterized protein LOC131207116 [Anopheles bellator]